MRSLPIYKGEPDSPVRDALPLERDTGCRRCGNAGRTPETTCLPVDGSPGGVLILDSFPTRADAAMRRPLAGSAAAVVRQSVERHTHGPVLYASALRCTPVGQDTTTMKLASSIDACSGYLHQTIREACPTRIIAIGGPAIYALTGKAIQPQTTRGGFAWVPFEHGIIPVFFVLSHLQASRNRFLARWLEEDLEWALTAEPPTVPPEQTATAHIVETVDDARAAIAAARAARWTAIDAEWAGRPYDRDFRLLSLALTPAPRLRSDGSPDLNDPLSSSAHVWPLATLQQASTRGILTDYLRDPTARKVGSYFKSDTVAFHAALQVWTRGVAFDTRLLRRLMDVEASGRLADMAHLVGRGGHKDELKAALSKAVAEHRKQARKGGSLFGDRLPPNALPSHGAKLVAGAEPERYGFAFVEPDLLHRYNASDTVTTAKVGSLLESWLAAEPAGMQNVARKVVTPAGDAYARIESWGMGVDKSALDQFRAYLDLQIAEVGERFRAYGYDPANPEAGWNPNSNAHVADLLFKKLKLPSAKTTDSGAQSTDADALESLAEAHPVVPDLLAWRKLQKMRGTYALGMAEHVRDDGRIHPSIHPDGARTGRTSSSDPNLQNIPSVESPDPEQAKMARMLRDCFVPAPGHVLVEFDYSQLELRVAADLSGDPAMLDIFKTGQDYHLRTAQLLSQQLWGIPPEQVTDTHRREVKPVNFALLYDDDPYGIAFRIGVDVKQAEKVRDAIFGCFPVLAKWIKDRVRETAATGHSWTWWDGAPARRRPLISVAEDERSSFYKTARRGSWNGPIQGTGNEYLVASAIETVDWILGDGIPAKVLVTIHDSMLLEVRRDALDEVFERVPQIMAGHATKHGVPLAADAKAGLTWGDMRKWKKGAPCPV